MVVTSEAMVNIMVHKTIIDINEVFKKIINNMDEEVGHIRVVRETGFRS